MQCNAYATAFLSVNDLTAVVIRKIWAVPAGAGTVHFTYPTGIVLAPGQALGSSYNPNALAGDTCGSVTLNMYGYLSTN